MIELCAPTDEAGNDFDEQIKSFLRNDIFLAEIRGILNKNVLDLSKDEAKYCYDKLTKNNIKVWSISSPIGKRDFNIPFEKFRERTQKAIDACYAFHCKNIRVFSFFNHKNNIDKIVKLLGYVVNEAAKHGFTVSLENEKGSYAQDCIHTEELLDKIEGLKYVYDSSNFIQVGESANLTLDRLFHRAMFVHFKDGVHKNDDADITPVGQGEANIKKLISLVDRDMVFSLEHHLKFATSDIPYESIKDSCNFVYKNIVDAFDDACKHARKMLNVCGYNEFQKGKFTK